MIINDSLFASLFYSIWLPWMVWHIEIVTRSVFIAKGSRNKHRKGVAAVNYSCNVFHGLIDFMQKASLSLKQKLLFLVIPSGYGYLCLTSTL